MAQGLTTIATDQFNLGANTVGDVQADSTDPLAVDKAIHLHRPQTNFGVDIASLPSASEWHLYTFQAAGIVRGVFAGAYDTGSATSTLTFIFKLDGVSIMSSNLVVSDTDPNFDPLEGSKNSSLEDAAVGQALSVEIQLTATGGSPVGPYAFAAVQEAHT